MNITRENFEDKFEVMCEAIRASHFIAIDAEFTGLRLPDAPREKAIDSVKARYDSARSSSSSFMLTQYGVCCFRYDDEGRLEARPFNSFILPSTKFGRDRVYSCQQSSMAFLSQHGFDFNAWIADGVSFLSRAEEAAIEAKLKAGWVRDAAAAAEKQEAAEKEGAVAVAAPQGKDESVAAVKAHTARDGKTTFESLDGDQQAMILDARKQVEDLVEEATSGGEYTEKSLKFDPMGGKDRWLMFEFVGSNNPAVKLSVLKGAYAARGIGARTVCPDPKLQAIAEAKLRVEAEAKQLEDLRRAAGFRRVVDVISKAGKPVITHNGLLDLVHTHDKFVGPVPADLDEGTQALHALFPLLIDNKVVMTSATAAGLQFPRTTLGEGHQWLRTKFPQQPKVAEAEAEVTAEAEAEATVGAGAAAASAAVEPGPANGQAEVVVAVAEDAAAAAAAAAVPHPLPTNSTDGDGDKVSPPGGGGGAEVEVVAGGDGEKGDAGVAAEAVSAVSAAAAAEAELKRRAWDATFAPGFEERYAAGGQEHEAGFDAYLTGCCFAAAATLGLGVGVEELKGMASGGEVPAALSAVSNAVPLFRILGGQRICLPGPAPPLDLSCYVHVSGFPSAARTDAIMRPLKAVEGCDGVWFHWIDDTSGLAECPSAEGARALLEAASSATAAAAAADAAAAGAGGGGGGAAAVSTGAASAAAESEPSRTRVVDPTQLVLEDMKLVQLDSALLYGDDDGQKEGEEKICEKEGRGAKRPLEEGDKVEEQPAKKKTEGGDVMVL